VSIIFLGLVIGVIAGALVARRALRIPIQEALSHE
jgi:hypothetical protein